MNYDENEIIRPSTKAWYYFLSVLVALCLLAMVLAPVHAMTILMSNPGGMSERDIAVYYANGTLQGLWNSTSVIDLDANESYIFALKPIQTNPFEDPTYWFINGFIPFLTSNAVVLVFAMILIGLAVRGG